MSWNLESLKLKTLCVVSSARKCFLLTRIQGQAVPSPFWFHKIQSYKQRFLLPNFFPSLQTSSVVATCYLVKLTNSHLVLCLKQQTTHIPSYSLSSSPLSFPSLFLSVSSSAVSKVDKSIVETQKGFAFFVALHRQPRMAQVNC